MSGTHGACILYLIGTVTTDSVYCDCKTLRREIFRMQLHHMTRNMRILHLCYFPTSFAYKVDMIVMVHLIHRRILPKHVLTQYSCFLKKLNGVVDGSTAYMVAIPLYSHMQRIYIKMRMQFDCLSQYREAFRSLAVFAFVEEVSECCLHGIDIISSSHNANLIIPPDITKFFKIFFLLRVLAILWFDTSY